MSQQRAGGGLAVGTRDNDRVAVLEEELADRLGKGRVGEVSLAYGDRLVVIPADHVADDNQIWIVVEILCAVPVHQLDASLLQLG